MHMYAFDWCILSLILALYNFMCGFLRIESSSSTSYTQFNIELSTVMNQDNNNTDFKVFHITLNQRLDIGFAIRVLCSLSDSNCPIHVITGVTILIIYKDKYLRHIYGKKYKKVKTVTQHMHTQRGSDYIT